MEKPRPPPVPSPRSPRPGPAIPPRHPGSSGLRPTSPSPPVSPALPPRAISPNPNRLPRSVSPAPFSATALLPSRSVSPNIFQRTQPKNEKHQSQASLRSSYCQPSSGKRINVSASSECNLDGSPPSSSFLSKSPDSSFEIPKSSVLTASLGTAVQPFTIGVKRSGPRQPRQSPVSPKSKSADRFKTQLLKQIDEGLIKNFATSYAKGSETVDVNGVAEEISRRLKDYITNVDSITSFIEKPLKLETPNEDLPKTETPKGSPTPSEVEQAMRVIDQGDVLGLNMILKETPINQFMDLCVNKVTSYNPLHYACLQGQYQIVHLLLKKKADPAILATGENVYAIHLFLRTGITKALEAIEKSISFSEGEETEPRHSFFLPVVQRLLVGIPINAQDSKGDTLFHYACHSAPVEVVQLLFDKGADPNTRNGQGLVPFQILMDSQIQTQKHLIAQMILPKLNISLIQTQLKKYLKDTCAARNRDLYYILSQLEHDIEEIVYFERDFLDFPLELSDSPDGHVSLIKAATFDELISKVILTDHGDEEAYLAFSLKLHTFGGLDSVLSQILAKCGGVGSAAVGAALHGAFSYSGAQTSSSSSSSSSSWRCFCKYLCFLLKQPHLVGESKEFKKIVDELERVGGSKEKSAEEKELQALIADNPTQKEIEEVAESLRAFQPNTSEDGRHSLDDLQASDTAKRLTMWNMYLHQSISPMDLLRYAEFSSKLDSTESGLEPYIVESLHRVQAAIRFFNDVSFWTASTVLLAEGGENRKDRLEYMIKVMDLCFVCKNYNTTYAILLGLKLRAVSQLGLMENQSPPILSRYNAICEFFSYQGSHKVYRDALMSVHAPALPYLGILLRDLTYANDGSSDILGSKKLFNLYKLRRIGRLISQYHTNFFSKLYTFNVSPEIAKCLGRISELTHLVNEEVLLQLSKGTETSSSKLIRKGVSPKTDISKLKIVLKELFSGKKTNIPLTEFALPSPSFSSTPTISSSTPIPNTCTSPSSNPISPREKKTRGGSFSLNISKPVSAPSFSPPPSTHHQGGGIPRTVTKLSQNKNMSGSGGISLSTLNPAANPVGNLAGYSSSSPNADSANLLAGSRDSLTSDEGSVYVVCVSTSDGSSLGFLQAEPNRQAEENKPMILKVVETPTKETNFQIKKVPDAPGKCLCLLNVSFGGLVSSSVSGAVVPSSSDKPESGADSFPPISPWNVIDTTTTKWKIHSNSFYQDAQFFYLNGGVIENGASTKEPLHFYLKKVLKPSQLQELVPKSPKSALRKGGVFRLFGNSD